MSHIQNHLKTALEYKFSESLPLPENFQKFCGKKLPNRVDIAAAFCAYIKKYNLDLGQGQYRLDQTLADLLGKPVGTVEKYADLHKAVTANLST